MGTQQASRSSDRPPTHPPADAPGRSERLRFPARLRLRRSRDFERTLSEGLRLTDGCLTLWALPNGLTFSRFGLIVGRRLGHAVQRNRHKRILREAFRLGRPRLAVGLDIVCAPRVGARIELWRALESLSRLTARASRRLAEQAPGPGR